MRTRSRISVEGDVLGDVQDEPGAEPSDPIRKEIEQTVRQHYGRMLSSLIYQFGDIDLAEDVLQEAMLAAINSWSLNGLPNKPVPWLMVTAKNKALDNLRRQQAYLTIEKQMLDLEQINQAVHEEADEYSTEYPDHRLSLIFTCCHPALAQPVRVALTLKTLCGLSTSQIASAFLASETTMAQRLVRAKRKIKTAGIPYQVPPSHLIDERLNSVLAVIYFIFNEGYSCSSGSQLLNEGLCDDAIHLASMMLKLLPEEPEVKGLLALILFHHARAMARVGRHGELIDLQHQNRADWNQSLIKKADQLLRYALIVGRTGVYQIQAAISAVHAHALKFDETDWKQIVMLYHRLEAIDGSPVIQLNLAVALSYAEDPDIALMYLDQIEDFDALGEYHPYYLTRADFLHRLGSLEEARSMYQKALAHCDNTIERDHIQQKVQALGV
ncbi:MAG: RNA polymerase sigma factor [bacterium]